MFAVEKPMLYERLKGIVALRDISLPINWMSWFGRIFAQS
jgi:hypothetical protein